MAQLGDSRALLLRGGGEKEKSRCLTADHCASDPGERARIEAAGGTVSYDEIGRHLVNKRLAMSRSIGEADCTTFYLVCMLKGLHQVSQTVILGRVFIYFLPNLECLLNLF